MQLKQDFFRAGEFFWNQGTSINNHLQHEKERTQGKISFFFLLETFKNCTLNDKFNPQMTAIGAFFPKTRALFSNFQKSTVQTSHPSPSSYALVYKSFIMFFRFLNIPLAGVLFYKLLQVFFFSIHSIGVFRTQLIVLPYQNSFEISLRTNSHDQFSFMFKSKRFVIGCIKTISVHVTVSGQLRPRQGLGQIQG